MQLLKSVWNMCMLGERMLYDAPLTFPLVHSSYLFPSEMIFFLHHHSLSSLYIYYHYFSSSRLSILGALDSFSIIDIIACFLRNTLAGPERVPKPLYVAAHTSHSFAT